MPKGEFFKKYFDNEQIHNEKYKMRDIDELKKHSYFQPMLQNKDKRTI